MHAKPPHIMFPKGHYRGEFVRGEFLLAAGFLAVGEAPFLRTRLLACPAPNAKGAVV